MFNNTIFNVKNMTNLKKIITHQYLDNVIYKFVHKE